MKTSIIPDMAIIGMDDMSLALATAPKYGINGELVVVADVTADHYADELFADADLAEDDYFREWFVPAWKSGAWKDLLGNLGYRAVRLDENGGPSRRWVSWYIEPDGTYQDHRTVYYRDFIRMEYVGEADPYPLARDVTRAIRRSHQE